MHTINLLIADDHIVVRKGIRMFLDTEPSILVVAEAENGREAISLAKTTRPDVILMDLVMPHTDGVEAIIEIKRSLPDVKIIVLTTFAEDVRIRSVLEAGADGYLLKDADGDSLVQAIHDVMEGDVPLHPKIARHIVKGSTQPHMENGVEQLTGRETEVLQLVAKGMSNRGVAQALGLSQGTIKVHVSNILAKLNASSRTEAAFLALQMGIIAPEEG